MIKPLISVIIVNYNGKKWLKNCFESLRKQTYKNFEIIFVDNNSSDDSIEFVKKQYPETVTVINSGNLGFAGGNNSGLKKARGKYVFLLNNDTVVEKNILESLENAFSEIPNLGVVQPKIVMMNNPNKLDACGSYWTSSTYLYHYGYEKNEKLRKYNQPMPFFSQKGAAILIKREVINKIGLFDNDFWCYYEETDFCHRVWGSGYECWYYPKSKVYHANGGTSITFNNELIQFHSFKNKIQSFIKNFEIKNLVLIIPIFLIISFVLALQWLFQGKIKHFLSYFKAIYWNCANFRKVLAKRRTVQKQRKISDREIFDKVKRNPNLTYYYFLFVGLEKFKDKEG